MNKLISIGFISMLITGCAGMQLAPKDAKRVFTYDYQITSVKKDVLWTRARDYFANTYGDSRSVLRVQDKTESSLIGRAAAIWPIGTIRCSTEYNLKFQSKDGKARLQLELLEGVPSHSSCTGWAWPSQSGYESIVNGFNRLSGELEQALKSGSTFSDF